MDRKISEITIQNIRRGTFTQTTEEEGNPCHFALMARRDGRLNALLKQLEH